jgi:hypothetical protein
LTRDIDYEHERHVKFHHLATYVTAVHTNAQVVPVPRAVARIASDPSVETLAVLAKLVTTLVPMMAEYSDMRLRHEEEDGCLRVALLGLGADLLEFTIKEL